MWGWGWWRSSRHQSCRCRMHCTLAKVHGHAVLRGYDVLPAGQLLGAVSARRGHSRQLETLDTCIHQPPSPKLANSRGQPGRVPKLWIRRWCDSRQLRVPFIGALISIDFDVIWTCTVRCMHADPHSCQEQYNIQRLDSIC